MAHFMRNAPSRTPPSHRERASAALKAVFAQESREAALAKAGTATAKTESGKPGPAANRLREGIGETTTCLPGEPPSNHGIKPRTDNMIERLNREIRRRTRVVGCFPDSNSASHARMRPYQIRHHTASNRPPTGVDGYVPAR